MLVLRDEILKKIHPILEHGGHLKIYPRDEKGQVKKNTNVGKLPTLERATKEIAKKMNKSESVIQREIQISRDIIPEVKDFIKNKKIPKKDALKIARIKKHSPDNWQEKQKEIIEKIKSGEAKKVGEATAQIRREEVFEKIKQEKIEEAKQQKIIPDQTIKYLIFLKNIPI